MLFGIGAEKVSEKRYIFTFGIVILVVIINKGYIIKIVQMSLKRLFSLTTGRLGSLRVKFNDPNKDFKEALQNFKKKIKQKITEKASEMGEDQEKKYQKYVIGFFIYIGVVAGLYQLKKERAIPITHEQALAKVKKGQISQIVVVRQTKNDSDSQNPDSQTESKKKQKTTNFRKVYMKIDGLDYITYVPEIGIFYEKINQFEKSKLTQRVKIIEKDEIYPDFEFKRFFSAVNRVILPLIFPILLFNSSIGKVFKTKVLGQMEGYRPEVKFSDIAGLGNAKIEISQLVDFLRDPAKYKKIGAKVPKGALLAGPPGTGKTMLAKACAGEANVPFFSVSGSEFVELYAGMGANRVRDLFKNAKKQTPAIIFIDQIDAIGRKRGQSFGGGHDQRANTLNQLLVQMDGFGTHEDIIVLAATNRKEMLDNALTRPGRFDRIVQIQLPDIKGRQQILEIYLNKIKLSPSQTLLDYAKRLATLTYGFSGADLANLCNEAAILAVRKKKHFVEPDDFEAASDRVLAGLEQNLNLAAQEKKKIAYHQSGHAVVAWFSQGASPLLKISIVPRSKGSLGFAQYLPNESTLMNKKQLYDQICVILGGRMAEQFFFKECSSGAADDLQKVRNLAQSMVLRFGMSSLFPNYAPIQTEGHNIYSEQTAAKIDKEVMKIIKECTELTAKKVKLYKDKIESLAEEVLKKENLNHQQIKAILGERPFEVKQNYKQFLTHSSQTKRAEVIV